ncbi:MAG: M23 family metallopeptidase [Hyphomonadaceae bacterium]|nr:M23 family metallopeptidase [Hyphomonadaceae bacterium]
MSGVVWGLVLIGAGWIGGSLLPAPTAITDPIVARVPGVVARFGVDDLTAERLGALLSERDQLRFRREVSALAARAGEAILVENDAGNLAEVMAALPIESEQPPAATPPLSPSSALFETSLSLCPGMRVSNAPAANAARELVRFSSVIEVEGVRLAANPTRGACLSSAMGPRGRGMHRGVDYHARDGGPILAAGDGVVREASYRNDYGNMLLIDHGNGVFTRYAHLSSFAEGVVAGASVRAGQQIGLMGNTASYAIPIHLHYEILTGDYNTPRASFGLTPRSPFS